MKFLKKSSLRLRCLNQECVTKRTLHDFINNVVADLFADMLLQPKGRGHVSREDIMQFINEMK